MVKKRTIVAIVGALLVASLLSGCAFLQKVFGIGPVDISSVMSLAVDGTSTTSSTVDFGPVDPSTSGLQKKVTITNDTATVLHVDSIDLSGDSAFTESSSIKAPFDLAQGDSVDVSATFVPTQGSDTSYTGNVAISGSYGGKNASGTISLKGDGNYAPKAQFSISISTINDAATHETELPDAEGKYVWDPTVNSGIGAYVHKGNSNSYYVYQINDPNSWSASQSSGWHWMIASSFVDTTDSSLYLSDEIASNGGTQLAAIPPDSSGSAWDYAITGTTAPKAGAEVDAGGGQFSAWATVYTSNTLDVTPFDFYDKDGDLASGTNGSPTYQWQSASSPNGAFTDISGATGSSITLSNYSLGGKWVRCVVTVTAQSGVTTGSSSTNAVYVNLLA